MKLAIENKLYQLKRSIDNDLADSFSNTSELTEAILYALSTGGKRVRPIITYLVSEALGFGLDVKEAALASEFFHTASLIADDLPCMDNDDFRRNLPSTHKKYGETIALLASYALITEGFRKIEQCGRKMRKAGGVFSEKAFEAIAIALECASRCAGLEGAVYGQYLDLYPSGMSEALIKRTIYLKTVTLFEGAFVLGFVFGGGDFAKLDRIKELSYHFGYAFQIRDDLHDLEEDSEKKEHANLALAIGKDKARTLFFSEIEKANAILQELSLLSPEFSLLQELLSQGM